MLNARFSLCGPQCTGQIHVIAVINHGAKFRKILEIIGDDPRPPLKSTLHAGRLSGMAAMVTSMSTLPILMRAGD
jgi:hypothetical protein